MAQRKVVWTERALRNRKSIFNYWYERNGSKDYPVKLHKNWQRVVSIAAMHPTIFPCFNLKRDIHYAVEGNYRIYYTYNQMELVILSIWDTRRNPKDLIL